MCRQGHGDPENTEVHIVCVLIGGTGGKTLALAVLVAKERSSRALMSTVVPRKSTEEFVSKRVVAFMRELGCETKRLAAFIREGRDKACRGIHEGRTKVPSGLSWRPACSSKSDGVIEPGIQTIQGMVRSTGEYIVRDGAGVWKLRTVRRKIGPERWNMDTIKLVGRVPGRRRKDEARGRSWRRCRSTST